MRARKAKASDVKYFLDCRKETAKGTFPEMKVDKKREEWHLKKLIDGKHCFVLESAEPIGLISFSIDGKIGHVSYLCIRKKFRGNGYSKMLMQKAEDLLFKNGAKLITLNVTFSNDIALNLYKKRGYVPFRYIMKKVKK